MPSTFPVSKMRHYYKHASERARLSLSSMKRSCLQFLYIYASLLPVLCSIPPPSVGWFNITAAGISDLSSCGDSPTCVHYEAQALVFSISGLLNRGAPRLMLDTGAMNYDAPQSDATWKAYFESERGFSFTTIEADVCSLVDHFKSELSGAAVLYESDGWSVFLAMTYSGLFGSLPVSQQLVGRYSCLASLIVTYRIPQFSNHTQAYEWAKEFLLPHASLEIIFNANFFPNTQQALMSVDYPLMQRAFIMNIRPCWEMVGSPPCNSSQISDTLLFTSILQTRGDLVSVWGWSDPEHAYTNATTHAGGAVFCTFSTSNLAFWAALSRWSGSKGLPVPRHHQVHPTPERDAVYITFETNEGDTPRILTSQFLSQWMSPRRGSIPVSWAIDPMLADLFPDLWNYFIETATSNDTFVAGVDGAGYVYVRSLVTGSFVPELGANARAYEERAAQYLSRYNVGVVDVGIANIEYPATSLQQLQEYRNTAGAAVTAFLNACGSAWGQRLVEWLDDGTPVINSVCSGPGSSGNFLFYYGDSLNKSAPARDLARRIEWAAQEHAEPGKPLFLLAFGGLGVFGGLGDFFEILHDCMAALPQNASRKFVVVGGDEFGRLARMARGM